MYSASGSLLWTKPDANLPNATQTVVLCADEDVPKEHREAAASLRLVIRENHQSGCNCYVKRLRLTKAPPRKVPA